MSEMTKGGNMLLPSPLLPMKFFAPSESSMMYGYGADCRSLAAQACGKDHFSHPFRISNLTHVIAEDNEIRWRRIFPLNFSRMPRSFYGRRFGLGTKHPGLP
jgi:hypothetical protein